MRGTEFKKPPDAVVETDLDTLIANAQRDRQQFAALYDRFLPPVYRYISQRVYNQQVAEEITSQTFLAAFEAFPSYRHRGYFAAWLFSIARKKIADHYRKDRHEQSLDQAIQIGENPHYLGQVISNERMQLLQKALMRLPEKEQELLRLRFSAELSFREMAVLSHKSEEAIKKSFYRLLAQLQSQMEEEDA